MIYFVQRGINRKSGSMRQHINHKSEHMNKKTYIAPKMEAAELELQVMIAGSNFNVSISNETTNDDAKMSNNRRGSWGDLWQ